VNFGHHKDWADFQGWLETNSGAFDAFVHCAGYNKPCDFDCSEERDYREMLHIDVVVPQAIIKRVRPLGVEKVVLIGSYSGQVGGPRTAHYAASKGAMIQMARCAARFYAPRMLINVVAPGYVRGPMSDTRNANIRSLINAIPMGRMAEPRDVSPLVFFLCNSQNTYITGQTINVNGGLLMT
jgi:3-oxoacyl-[acyl-carrier protein] reductase